MLLHLQRLSYLHVLCTRMFVADVFFKKQITDATQWENISFYAFTFPPWTQIVRACSSRDMIISSQSVRSQEGIYDVSYISSLFLGFAISDSSVRSSYSKPSRVYGFMFFQMCALFERSPTARELAVEISDIFMH